MDPGRWAPDTTLPPLRCHPQQLWAGPEAQVGQDRQGRGTCRRPPPSPPTGQSTPFCVPPQALTDVGSAFKAVTPPTTVQRRPHHQRHPEAQHPFPGAPAWLCCSLEPKLSQAQRFQVPSPHHVPTSPGHQVQRAASRTRRPRQTKSFFHHILGDSLNSGERSR